MSSSTRRLQGKVAIVTGGAAGFGEAISLRFAEEGAKVIIADIATVAGEQVAYKSANITFQKTDVTRKADWDALVEVALWKHGRLDILVNNAGATYSNKPTLEVTEAEFQMCFDVNVKSVFLGNAAVMPILIKQNEGGAMINVASIGATRPRPGITWYNASKGAVYNVTKGLAAEYGRYHIRVNSVCPLLSGTQLFAKFAGVEDTPENREKLVAAVPMGRLTEPLDVANACLFFASDESRFVTGINMEVDGGRTI